MPEKTAASDYTGRRQELVRLLDSDDENLMDDLCGWQYAAIARLLAEAGAVHPAVHTPTRIMNYLEEHGWKRIESPTKPQGGVFWSAPEPGLKRWARQSWSRRPIELDAPLCDDLSNYADAVRVVVNRIAWAQLGHITAPDDVRTAILLEISAMPDEVAW